MRTIVVVLIVLILLVCWFAYQVLKLLRSSLHGPITQEIPEIAHFGEVVEYHPGDTTLPDMADREELWGSIKSLFEDWDKHVQVHRLKHNLEDQVWQREREALLAGPVEPFVPKRRYFGPLEGREMEFCHGVGQLVVHRKTCPRAPHEERRRYIWAFDAAQLGEWTDAEPGEWRHCRVCRPGEPAGARGGAGPEVAAGAPAGGPQQHAERAGHPGRAAEPDAAPEEAVDAVRLASS